MTISEIYSEKIQAFSFLQVSYLFPGYVTDVPSAGVMNLSDMFLFLYSLRTNNIIHRCIPFQKI